jgi:hypothetical protein
MIIHYLSASRLKTYLQCSEKYFQTYENKVRSDAVHLRFGVMLHTVFERWFQEDKDIREIYEEEWRKADVVDLQYYKDGIEMVENFEIDNNKDEIMAIGFEVPFAINILDNTIVDTDGVDFSDYEQVKVFLEKLENDDKPYIYGFIDRIDVMPDGATLRIRDYKTSRVALSREEASSDEQLSMYALVAQYMYPEFENVVLELDYVRLRERVYSYRTDEELEIFKDWLIHMYHQIKEDTSPKATLNKYCGWCDARHGCHTYLELLATDPDVEKEREFTDMDEELTRVNTLMKILKDRKYEIENKFKAELKSTDNEPINVTGGQLYVTNNIRRSYDVSTVITAFPKDFDKLLSVNKGDVDKLIKGNEEIQQMLDETAESYFIAPTLRRKKVKE